jgi:hypothetical protein
VIALVAVLTAGCSTTSPPAAPVPSEEASAAAIPPVPGLEAEAVRLRTDEAAGGRFQVRVTNTGKDAFTVTAVALDSPGFTAVPATPVTAEFAPGRVIDLPTPFGSPVCGTAPTPAAARVVVVRPGGAAESVLVPLGGDAVDVVHGEECAVLAVAEVVDVTVTGLADVGDELQGSLTLSRRDGDEPVVATELNRSVLINAVAEDLPLELGPKEQGRTTAVSFTPATCDPHVLSETKKPYVFPLTVRVGGGDPVPVDLPLDQAALDRLAALVQRVCADT